MEKSNFENAKKEVTRDQILKFFIENDIDKLNFDTLEEAEAHVNLINNQYGDIAFVAEDMGGFAVKFKVEHLGEGFEGYKSGDEDSELNKAA